MESKFYGGNEVRKYGAAVAAESCVFAEAPYRYYTVEVSPATRLTHSSCLVYFQRGTSATITVEGNRTELACGDAFYANGKSLSIEARSPALFFVVADDVARPAATQLVRKDDLKLVTKPWGSETWINYPGHDFSLKKIIIKSGTKTSLQYHQFKTETNVLFSGEAKLTYKHRSDVANDDVVGEDLAITPLESGDVLHVTPLHIHRLEAITDLELLEASTNHLDDVIRLQDDFKRLNGRIESEHAKR